MSIRKFGWLSAVASLLFVVACQPQVPMAEPSPNEPQNSDSEETAAPEESGTPDESTESKEPTTTEKPVTTDEVQKEVGEAAAAATQLAKQKRDEYIAALDKQLEELDKSIDAMKEKGKDLTEDAKQGWSEALADLEKERQQYQEQYDALAESGGKAWQDLKEGMSAAWKDLKQAADDAAAQLESASSDSGDTAAKTNGSDGNATEGSPKPNESESAAEASDGGEATGEAEDTQ